MFSPEDGLKIDIVDNNTNKQVALCIDTAIDVVSFTVFENYHSYSETNLIETFKFIKSSFLCFIEPDFDINLMIASIVHAKANKNIGFLTQYTLNSTN